MLPAVQHSACTVSRQRQGKTTALAANGADRLLSQALDLRKHAYSALFEPYQNSTCARSIPGSGTKARAAAVTSFTSSAAIVWVTLIAWSELTIITKAALK
jgi:aspartate/tyrosine/aromatic aminotransferase